MASDSIERDTFIAAPAERVWTLLTEAEHLGTWFGDAGAEIDLRPGGELLLRWTEHGTVRGRVELVDAPRAFSFRWALFGDEVVAGNSTLVEFTLAPEGSGTRLRVVESGFASLDRSEAERAEYVVGNTEGWSHELGHLGEYAQRLPV